MGVNTPMGKFKKGIKESKKIVAILELEYELTNWSDAKGNVNYENFLSICKKLNLMKTISDKELHEIY